ncbi:MAG: UvrB/UvrC motif-containing protein [Planctomycetes bacterium]|nr:UvrB/UvrC motif-containing protein [Planctomycetota bacterium]
MNFLCQHCKQAKATVHITDTIPEKHERHLCEACAEAEGVIIKQPQHTTSAILQEFIKHKVAGAGGDDHTCPRCGITFRQFQVKGQLGCPYDYEAFRSLLLPLIERAHDGSTHHVGKVPSTADSTVRRQTGLFRLRRELQEAVEHENYEEAARVRDAIQGLESAEPS